MDGWQRSGGGESGVDGDRSVAGLGGRSQRHAFQGLHAGLDFREGGEEVSLQVGMDEVWVLAVLGGSQQRAHVVFAVGGSGGMFGGQGHEGVWCSGGLGAGYGFGPGGPLEFQGEGGDGLLLGRGKGEVDYGLAVFEPEGGASDLRGGIVGGGGEIDDFGFGGRLG